MRQDFSDVRNKRGAHREFRSPPVKKALRAVTCDKAIFQQLPDERGPTSPALRRLFPLDNLRICSRLGRWMNFVGILWWMSILAFAVRRRGEAGN